MNHSIIMGYISSFFIHYSDKKFTKPIQYTLALLESKRVF
uniref:Uncharacterized protein n=1 Tax=Anguilla anguilla TaxID=7936 RepID=A0A0E9TLT2_ANGAN